MLYLYISRQVRREQMKQTALLASLKNMNESDEIEKFLKSQTEALQTISKRIDEETVKVQNALSGLDVSLNPQLTEVEVSKSVHAVEPVIESSFSNNTDINKKDK